MWLSCTIVLCVAKREAIEVGLRTRKRGLLFWNHKKHKQSNVFLCWLLWIRIDKFTVLSNMLWHISERVKEFDLCLWSVRPFHLSLSPLKSTYFKFQLTYSQSIIAVFMKIKFSINICGLWATYAISVVRSNPTSIEFQCIVLCRVFT